MRRLDVATRSAILFVFGMIGAVYEIVWSDADRPALIALIAGMLGLPAFVNMDSQRAAAKKDDEAKTK